MIVMTGDSYGVLSKTEFYDLWPDMVLIIPTLRRLKQEDCCVYEAIVGYTVNPRTVWTTD